MASSAHPLQPQHHHLHLHHQQQQQHHQQQQQIQQQQQGGGHQQIHPDYNTHRYNMADQVCVQRARQKFSSSSQIIKDGRF